MTALRGLKTWPRAKSNSAHRAGWHGLPFFLLAIVSLVASSKDLFADEGGVSFWLPGAYGSLAASPLPPGWSVVTTYYHANWSAGGNVALAREFSAGNVSPNFKGSMDGNLDAQLDSQSLIPSYTFASPVLNGQLSLGLMGLFARSSSSISGTLSGTITPPGTSFSRTDNLDETTWGFGDLYPQASLRWNSGVNNFMTYLTGDIPVGDYSSDRIANVGIGHGAIDAGGGYTYLNPSTGLEFSGTLGFTYNFKNQSTDYQNGIDMHFDAGASEFVTKQLQLGVVGYAYKQLNCDSGTGDQVGCFQSQVFGVGPQIGYFLPIAGTQVYANLKGYYEFGAEDRPEGWNLWFTIAVPLGSL